MDQGTTFTILWPALEPATGGLPDDAPHAHRAEGGTETILVVDDETAILQMTADALKHFGYTVYCAGSGEEALRLVSKAETSIDLVILDIGMPGMGGHRCLRELLALRPELTILIATGYAPVGKVQETLQAGAAGYISKPWQVNELLTRVREVLDGRAGPEVEQ